MLSTKLKEAAGNSADATLYVDDVFSTYLYTGNGSTQTITNGIDLAGKGGLVWGKVRSNADNHMLMDSARGYNKNLSSNITNPQTTSTPAGISANSDGFSLTTSNGLNESGWTYASWTFRKAAKFFDVVTYTGTGSARTIAHSLGVAPGMVIVKRTDTTGNWQVYSNGLTSAAYSIQLNLTNAQASAPTVWNSTAPTSSVFSVGTDATVNAAGGTYVAYLFAHDTSSTGIIQCGSFTTDGSGNATVNLGWEPQYVLVKSVAVNNSDWTILDTMRGAPTASSQSKLLFANTSGVETTGSNKYPIATGFQWADYASTPFIYMAIRMPNKLPTTGTQVYNAIYNSGDGTTDVALSTNFAVDLAHARRTNTSGASGINIMIDRLRGVSISTMLATDNTDAEKAYATYSSFNNSNVVINGNNLYLSGGQYIHHFFKRAPGFFDVVCYTGTGSATTQAHNLGVVPEMIIVKRRNAATLWAVYVAPIGATRALYLNSDGIGETNPVFWNDTVPTSSVFSLREANAVNGSSGTYVAYLFATLAGISKVGSYTGNGTSQNIDCGFAAGARFFLVKATSTTGSWWVWDSARGITAGNDPALQLNSTAAEITTADAVDPYSPGITVNQEATCSINASGVSYVYLAIS